MDFWRLFAALQYALKYSLHKHLNYLVQELLNGLPENGNTKFNV